MSTWGALWRLAVIVLVVMVLDALAVWLIVGFWSGLKAAGL